MRRGLCIGVGSFTPAGADDDEEPDLSPFQDLEFAAAYTRELHAALQAADYETALLVDSTRLGAKDLGHKVEGYLTGGEVAVVHVLSHGEHVEAGGVYVVGADGRRSPRTRVEDWRIQVTDDSTAPTTLFLLDLCHAGAANRYWQPPKAGEQERAWVIAAAGADQPAYAGRLTRAATAVINDITAGRLDIAETLPWVTFDVLLDRIRKRVRQLAADEGGHQQDPVGTPVEGLQPPLRFFKNPDYRKSRVAELATQVEAATARFLDPVLDEEHFRERATGRGPASARMAGGVFTGRAPQLRRLAEWMDDHDDHDPARGGLMVVTGSPGVGKSALLGVLVCAAHPQLREPTRELWRAARPYYPSQNNHLAAVHARQRTLPEITASVQRQLSATENSAVRMVARAEMGGAISSEVTPTELIAEIAARPTPPVIVLDALDEALGAQQILDELLLPLAAARRSDGSLACRLLVGTRPWPEFEPLLALGAVTDALIDLDAIPTQQRREDLTGYVTALLDLLPGLADTTYHRGRRAFANAVATTLVRDEEPDSDPSRHTEGARRWGEFLVAALYTHTATLSDPEWLADPTDAARIGADVPRTLPEVLELDLASQPGSPWRRPLLTVLAYALGAGIPRAVLPSVVAAVAGQSEPAPVDQLTDELEALRFYLRTTADTDGSALYRLFHQGLADYLRISADDPETVETRLLDGLLATVPVTGHE
jgi:hypothetical protein